MTAEVSLERHVEELNVNTANVVAHPLLKDIHEEAAVLFSPDRAFRYQVASLRVEQALASRLFAPAKIGDLDRRLGGAFDDRNELYPLRLQFISKETIDRAAVVLVCGVNSAQDVEVDPVLTQLPPAPHHLIESALLAAVHTVSIVKLAGAVDAEADQEIVLLEKLAPFIIEKDAVGLKCVLYGLTWLAVLLDEFDGAPEKVQLHERRLAALPRHRYRGRAV